MAVDKQQCVQRTIKNQENTAWLTRAEAVTIRSPRSPPPKHVFKKWILSFAAPISEVHIQQDENSITCSSKGIYPEPKLTWSTSPPSTNTFKKPTTVQQTDQQLYTISSSLIRVHGVTDLTYSCTVSAGTNQKTTLLKESKSFLQSLWNCPQNEFRHQVFTGLFHLCLCYCVLSFQLLSAVKAVKQRSPVLIQTLPTQASSGGSTTVRSSWPRPAPTSPT